MDTPDTPAQAKVRAEYEAACRALAAAAVAKREAQVEYEAAFEKYNRAFGAARAVGVLK